VIATFDGDRIVVPGIATAHSHAFQRALRGRTQRAGRASFWSWRGLMYQLAQALTPESIYALSRFAFVELARAGVTAVGEFHYVHHQPGGAPYDDRTILSDAVIRAALDAGIRITLLRVIYARAGFGRALEEGQRRFVDADIEHAFDDIEVLAKRYADDPRVRIGVAPHSLRAVPIEGVVSASKFARDRAMPLHMHVSEQRREVRECLAEHARRPIALLHERGVLDERFVAVHATHVTREEAELLAAARSFACVCRTTERDLGDGLAQLTDLAAARLAFGTDSHASSDPFEEARAAELDERSRIEKRCTLDATVLLEAMTANGYAAIGMPNDGDRVVLDRTDPALVGCSIEDDAVVFAANASCVDEVIVNGTRIVERGEHAGYDETRRAFEAAMR
jgi:formimidoylglutamate deiminase